MEFQVGDKAVYPAHGVGIIQSIETMEFEGEKLTFYVVKILDNAMTINLLSGRASHLVGTWWRSKQS